MISKLMMFGAKSVDDQHPPDLVNNRGRRCDQLDNVTIGKVDASFPSRIYQQQQQQHQLLNKTATENKLLSMNGPRYIDEVDLIRSHHHRLALVNNARLPSLNKNCHEDKQLVLDEFKLQNRLLKEHNVIRVAGNKHPRGNNVDHDANMIFGQEGQLVKKVRRAYERPDKVYIDSEAECKKMFPLPMLSEMGNQQDEQTKSMDMSCLKGFQKKWECLEWYSDRVDDTVDDQTAFVTEFFLRSMTSNPTQHLQKKIDKVNCNTSTQLWKGGN
jgi:hypothetical protein